MKSPLLPLLCAATLALGLAHSSQDEADDAVGTPGAWEYAYLSDWWLQAGGLDYFPRHTWATAERSVTADSWTQLFQTFGMGEDEIAGPPTTTNRATALAHVGSEGWELVDVTSSPVTTGTKGYWLVNLTWTFKRPLTP